MKKIELTQLQQDLIQKQLRGEYDPFFATEEEKNAYNDVIDKAQELLDELDAYDEMEDLLPWFWGKFQKQQEESGAEAAHTDVEQ